MTEINLGKFKVVENKGFDVHKSEEEYEHKFYFDEDHDEDDEDYADFEFKIKPKKTQMLCTIKEECFDEYKTYKLAMNTLRSISGTNCPKHGKPLRLMKDVVEKRRRSVSVFFKCEDCDKDSIEVVVSLTNRKLRNRVLFSCGIILLIVISFLLK